MALSGNEVTRLDLNGVMRQAVDITAKTAKPPSVGGPHALTGESGMSGGTFILPHRPPGWRWGS